MIIFSKKNRAFGAFALLFAVFSAGLYIGVREARNPAHAAPEESVTIELLAKPSNGVQPQNIDFSKFWKVWNLLNEEFVQPHGTGTLPTDEEKIDAAIRGLVDSYGDPYTEYFPPADAALFDANIGGTFGGVGMEVDRNEDGTIVIAAPLKSSPAEKAGVQSGDVILSVDGVPVAGSSIDEVIRMIRGEIGTTVKLTLSRTGVSQPFVIAIVRDTIQIPTLEYKNDIQNGIFEISLYNFSAHAADDFREALREFMLSGSTRLIIDVRGNPGGYLDSAVEMVSYFLPQGKAVVTEDYGGKQADIAHRSYGFNVFANKKLSMAILIDRGSASASEIFAGALQQHGIATLIGQRSFGKGSVQELIELGDGSELKITVAQWLTPDGTSISEGGLTPDIFATTTAKEYAEGSDPQKSAAVQWLVNR